MSVGDGAKSTRHVLGLELLRTVMGNGPSNQGRPQDPEAGPVRALTSLKCLFRQATESVSPFVTFLQLSLL